MAGCLALLAALTPALTTDPAAAGMLVLTLALAALAAVVVTTHGSPQIAGMQAQRSHDIRTAAPGHVTRTPLHPRCPRAPGHR